MSQETPKVCPNGHHFIKRSACPVCPICAAQEAKQGGIFSRLASPTRRALQNAGIETAEDLANYTEEELLKLHGLGQASLPKIRLILEEAGLKSKR